MRVRAFFLFWGIICCCVSQALSQQLTIREALSLAAQQPQLRAYNARAAATHVNNSLARNTLMPDLTVGYQAGYATYNNVTGMSYPGLVMPISGPPTANSTDNAVPGTAVAALLKWTPWTFGQREAAIEKAAAQYRLAGAEFNEALFRQQYAVLNVYLDLVYLRQLLASLQANTDRIRASLRQSLVLSREGLRAGIDTIQFQAALAQSQIDYLTTQRSYLGQLAELSRLTALQDPPENITLTDTLLASRLPLTADTTTSIVRHPQYLYYKAKVDLSTTALQEVRRVWRPHLDLWANAYSRGSGVTANGTVNKSAGWSPDHNNYGLGLQLSFPLLQFTRVRLDKQQYGLFLKADQAQLEQVALNLSAMAKIAHMHLQQDRLIAERTPVVTRAQQLAYHGLQVSYGSGLIDYTRLEQGRYDLLKAEIAQAGAYIQVWRSLLDMAVATGDLPFFIDQASQP